MSRTQLKISAAVLTTLIVAVLINAFDHLPGSVRAQIDSERAALASAGSRVTSAQQTVARETKADPALFQTVAASSQWPARFQQSAGVLDSAKRDMEELSRLEKSGHHRDQQRATTLLAHERGLRESALNQAAAIESEAARWTERKQHLASELQQMEHDYQAIRAFDTAPLTATIQRAETDWPEKKSDLESRLAAVTGIPAQSETLWQSSAGLRHQAAAGDTKDLDFGALFATADQLKASAAALPKQSAELESLAGQLYDSWDKILVDMDVRGIGSNRAFDQKIRTVRTHLGNTTSDEKWVQVSPATYDAMRSDLGMAIEHKPAGKYDSEAEHVAQPAGFAYMAPPSQGSNQYGYWEHRDGQSFWVWYGKYALLRDLLFNHSYRPLPQYDWEGYRSSRSRGETYYGRDFESGSSAPRYGSNGTSTQERYSGSTYAQRGGFRDSPYASRGGSYRDSPYASRSARDGDEDHSGRSFGRNSRPDDPHVAPPHEPSYHPAPRPAPRRMPGGGRRFGRH